MSIEQLRKNRLIRKALVLSGLTMAWLAPTQAWDSCDPSEEGECDGGTPAMMCMCGEAGCSWVVEEQCQC